MPAGRPSKYKKAYSRQIVDFMAEGRSATSFAAKIGVNRDTISEWCKIHPEFSVAFRNGLAAYTAFWEERHLAIGGSGGSNAQFNAIRFSLTNSAPDDFRERQHIDTTTNGKEINAPVTVYQLPDNNRS